MNYSKIRIHGFRGYSSNQTLKLAIPNNKYGSGLTVVLGPNNSGKSTIFEAFKAISQNSPPSITEGRRNKKAKERVKIELFSHSDRSSLLLETIVSGGSETIFKSKGIEKDQVKIMSLPSRRTFSPFFGKGSHTREQFIRSSGFPPVRGAQLDNFSNRIFNIQKSPEQLEKFNSVFEKVLNPAPEWHIEQNDSGTYYIKFKFKKLSHNSDGAGEGLLSLITIVDALYDSSEGDVIVIDEPELSLHPSLQKKLASLISEYSKTRQIVIFTHSPYFICWKALINGGTIARTVKKESGELKIYQLAQSTVNEIKPFFNNLNNPHILGLEAKEIFFLEDNVLLVEGQEDVVFYRRILDLLEVDLIGSFYGWGAGGSPNMDRILHVFRDLGFMNVCVVLDNNMERLKNKLHVEFPKYHFFTIPAKDVRDKDFQKERPAIEGLIDKGGKRVKGRFENDLKRIFSEINKVFQQQH